MEHQEFNSQTNYSEVSVYKTVMISTPHIHHSTELVYVTQGSVDFIVNDVSYTVSAGEFALIPPDLIHYYTGLHQCYYYIHVFSKDCTPTFFRLLENKLPKNVVYKCSDDTRKYYHTTVIDPFVKFIAGKNYFRTVTNEFIPELKLRSALYAVLSEFLTAGLVDNQGATQSLFGDVCAYIIENYTEELTLVSLANHFGYNPQYLSRALRKVPRFNFHNFLNQCRVDKACDMLRMSKVSITDISNQCGFNCIRSFNRIFKAFTGITPKDYRKNYVR